MDRNLQFGITSEFDCNYLPNKQERLLIAVDQQLANTEGYEWLMGQGFRRSGDQVYRPHCLQCKACQSLRVIISDFSPSKSQKRLLKKNQQFTVKYSQRIQDIYYPLYERYINELHQDGSMFPATFEQYQTFLTCQLTEQIFIELWDDEKLISVAVTDMLENALSAVYTFYDPQYRKSGLGVLSILKQAEYCQKLNKEFLYLGYQIDDCQKMNYKSRYYPHQRLINNVWKTVNK
jgi:arginine-tRNA-protein transferase